MNRRRRENIAEALSYLNKASHIVSLAYDCESDALENIPENFENTDRYASIEASADCLSDAVDYIDNAVASLEEAIA